MVDIYIYSDESGVFDYVHNNIFVFGGLIFLSKESKDICARKFKNAEKVVRRHNYPDDKEELKACRITPVEKGKLYRALNSYIKFGVIINQQNLLRKIFSSKKDKQRYLDYAFKVALKKTLTKLISESLIEANNVENIYVFVDEHTTATNGKYELREMLEQEFKYGTFNYNYNTHFPSIFPELQNINLKFCNSESTILIRAADIVANKFFYCAKNKCAIDTINKTVYVIKLP